MSFAFRRSIEGDHGSSSECGGDSWISHYQYSRMAARDYLPMNYDVLNYEMINLYFI